MKIEPKGAITPPAPTTNSPNTMSARERAIAKLTAQPEVPKTVEVQPVSPVLDANNVTPEELTGNVLPPTETKGQLDTTEASETPAATVEEAAPKTEAPADPLSQHYATLARKEKQLRAKVQAQDTAIKAREEALAAREAAIKAKEAEYQTGYIRKDSFKADPLSALSEAGMSYDQLTEAALNQPQDPQTRQMIAKIQADMEAKIKALTDAQEQQSKAYQDAQTKQYEQAVNQIRANVQQLVKTSPEFETIAATDSANDVVDLIERTWKEEGVLLSESEAAQQVEDYLVEEALKLSKIKKIQSRLQPKQESNVPPKQAVEATPPKQSQPIKTLTNTVGSNRPLSAKERAILAFKGELNKN